ncbi:GNAT family N-acetyltransferase [Elizabethkingia meningoseptica]|uniref:GNAT family N-acetyltransferase n=1 Tax=Elizabethkingia meningoseptica TaxID=238 RepID=UPI0022F15EEF|nr:GNAT family N-acetyltransferase [Elizabethkingia meningoseptica]EJK5329953.1 GNAT family N-acetyltransferase [Elizabethkingia meningoseptica]MDE5468601.1 GNAT family N-acetyltransferase [Elizabethkingia meningoseptica]MDE5475913.1 GNAT family N-acetyltransferase [Elizabethkingia meningoseptica]MDE5478848.1 GNAT family N-acetyltransferase [Elizabethkingia meningoseptica]MDE5484797.1 GNAT family N-acetyltransferase [Elizabethkingia meningoseptica]
MSEISLKKVIDDKMLMDFIQFPMTLYKNNPNFVPPLINDEKQIWDPKENPALAYSEAELYLAYKDNQVVGRIAVMINHKEGQELGIHKVRFGWIDFIDDLSVSKALLDKAAEYAKQHNINKIEGPMGFTNLDKAGMLTMGFDKIATMIGIYNFEYYPKHLEQLGLVKEKEWVEFEIVFPEILSEKVIKFNEIIKEKYQLKVLKFNNKKEILPLVEPMFKLLDETYKGLSTYTPITQQQIQTYKEKYFGFIDKDFIVCITDADDKLISFAITMPSYSKALQKANGKLFPFGWWHFLQAGKKNDRANFYLIGIHPEYQRRGVTAIIFKEIYDIFKKKGVKFLETNPELEENKNIQLLWQDYDPVNHKRRRTYSKEL